MALQLGIAALKYQTHIGPQGAGLWRCNWVLLRSNITPTAARKEPDERLRLILLRL